MLMKNYDGEIKVLNMAIRMAQDEILKHRNDAWDNLMLTKLVALEAEKIRITNEHNTHLPNRPIC